MIAHAATKNFSTVTGIIQYITDLVTQEIIPLLIFIALLAFIYGIVRFMMGGNNHTRQEAFKNTFIWAIIALFVMLAIVGIVQFLATSLGFGDVSIIPRLRPL